MCPGVEVALERQNLSRMYLPHQELERHFINIIITEKAECDQVLMRQRELGLQQLAGTADMAIDGHPSSFTAGPGARGTLTLVLTCITYPTCT